MKQSDKVDAIGQVECVNETPVLDKKASGNVVGRAREVAGRFSEVVIDCKPTGFGFEKQSHGLCVWLSRGGIQVGVDGSVIEETSDDGVANPGLHVDRHGSRNSEIDAPERGRIFDKVIRNVDLAEVPRERGVGGGKFVVPNTTNSRQDARKAHEVVFAGVVDSTGRSRVEVVAETI
jgi:hypothetical protein